MNQRLFFLFPDREHTLQAVEELAASGLDRARMHTIARDDVPLDGLPQSTPTQRADLAERLEFWGWRFNLAVFFVSLLVLVGLLAAGNGWWWLPLAIMVVSFLLGQRFTTVPNAHLCEFTDAIHHGEILLMTDVDAEQTDSIEHQLRKHHPEAVPGGASWNIPAFGL